MRAIAVLAAMGIFMLGAAPSSGQIVTPVLPPPPCQVGAAHCTSGEHIARRQPPKPAPAQRRACPQGTVYDPPKAACRVLPKPLIAPGKPD